jgi:cell division control protein 45
MFSLAARLGLTEAQWESCKIYIIDSHRPVHFNNIYFDQTPVIDEYGNTSFDTEIQNAKVIIIDDSDEIAEDIPSLAESCLYDTELPVIDSDGEEEPSSAHRRRIGEADDPTAFDDEEMMAAEKEERKHKRIATFKIENYCSKAHRSGSSALLMYSLATDLRKDTNESLWWGIIGLTDQFLNSYIGQEQYESALRAVVLEVSRLNPEDSTSVGRITFVNDFKFELLRYWTLYDSMYHSEYIATNLHLSNDRKNDTNELRTLLAKMGIPRTEAEQKYFSMKSSIQEELVAKLSAYAEEFKIPDFQFPTFQKIRHLAPFISAADCIHLATALLNQPPANAGKWEEEFYKAYDAILVIPFGSLIT